ncbi:MAG: glycogen debranching enzyme N-terminal domain-containing protein [Firmicutes bacterium]|jgi:predicted glycogen debranching enzyme|nr:glycogen debranching enzyme N-terminal domain-containing protein [Bacillota bacterium]
MITLTRQTSFPEYYFGPSSWEDSASGIKKEWLVTNGIGGYASSTLIGANTRSYHALLAASFNPPLDRQVLLSKIEEEIRVEETLAQLSTNHYRDKIHPTGYQHLIAFSQSPFPTWLYQVQGAILKKWIFMRHGQNTTVIGYELVEAEKPVDLYLLLFITKRNFHHLLRSDSRKFDQEKIKSLSAVFLQAGSPFLYVSSSKGEYYRNGEWYYNFQYVREKERGLDFEEDLFHPGTYAISLAPGEKVFIAASTNSIPELLGDKWQEEEEERLKEFLHHLPLDHPIVQKLALSTDAFVVKTSVGTSVIAGYPWFNEWGRDAFISIPGLFLVTNRIAEAISVVQSAVRHLKNGLIPNNFPDSPNQAPAYESSDASLWLIHAVYQIWKYSKNKTFIFELFPSLQTIIQAYQKGVHPFIKMREDGLIESFHSELPLTWMDAKVGPWIVTPRNGACVEVNALWFNSLRIMEELADRVGMFEHSRNYADLAFKVSSSFNQKFWNEEQKALYDYIGQAGPDSTIRPNQIFALSLPFSILPKEKEKKVFNIINERLYTPYGLRSLDPLHKDYKGVYQGDRWLRDGAYHQGTAWPWLLGPFMTALVKLEGEKARPKVRELLNPILAHLLDAGIGQISEIFGGDFPHHPSGCIAQAWSAAEVLRAYIEEGLGIYGLQ